MNLTGRSCKIALFVLVLSPLLFLNEIQFFSQTNKCVITKGKPRKINRLTLIEEVVINSENKAIECPQCECNSGDTVNRKPGHYNVGLLIMMTGKYLGYLNELKKTFDNNFLTKKTDEESYKLHYFIFTDGEVKRDDVTAIFQRRLGWPYDSMMRFEIYYNSSHLYQDMDYIFSVDADLQAIREVTPETIISDLTGTRHPGYPSRQHARDLPYDNHINSGSYIGDDEEGYYHFGAFWGGKKDVVMQMCKTIRRRIWADLMNNVMPAWHDESHLNRYMIDYPPKITLEAGYVTAEGSPGGVTAIIQLNKNRQEMTDCESAQHVCKIN